jgi:adenosylcobinamide-GDP ribazoletransferase
MASAAPARGDGLGAGVAGSGRVRIGAGLVSAVALAACLEERWVAMTAIGLGAGWAVGVGARRWLGGYTGDVLGAASVLAECGALLAASVR